MILYFAVVIILNSAANILLKMAMLKIGNLEGLDASAILTKVITSHLLWLGCICFMAALLAYSHVLSKVNLSIAYPIITSVAFAVVSLGSVFFLTESLNVSKIVGILFTIVGVWMIAR